VVRTNLVHSILSLLTLFAPLFEDMQENISRPPAIPENVVTRTTVLNSGAVEEKRQEILDYFHKSFDLYESLFECLKDDEAYYARANPLRHPLIFYYGHTAVFYINKLNVARLIDERIDPFATRRATWLIVLFAPAMSLCLLAGTILYGLS